MTIMPVKAARLLLIFAAWDFPFFPSSGSRRSFPQLGVFFQFLTERRALHSFTWTSLMRHMTGRLEDWRSSSNSSPGVPYMNSASQPLTGPSTELNLSQKNSFCRARNFPAVCVEKLCKLCLTPWPPSLFFPLLGLEHTVPYPTLHRFWVR